MLAAPGKLEVIFLVRRLVCESSAENLEKPLSDETRGYQLESDARNLRRPESSTATGEVESNENRNRRMFMYYRPSTPPPGDINHGAGAGHLILYLALIWCDEANIQPTSCWMKPRRMKQSDWSKSGRAPTL